MPEKKSLKILHIITDLKTGGAEMALYRISERLKNDFEQTIISLKNFGTLGPKIKNLGISVYKLGMRSNFPNHLAFFKLVYLIRKIKPDIIHTWLYHADLIGGIMGKFCGQNKIIWAIHNSDLSPKRTKLMTRMVVKLCARLSKYLPKKIISVSFVAKEIHIKLGYDENKFVVIPNSVDTTIFYPNENQKKNFKKELNLLEEVFLVGHIGRFHPQKNQQGFIECAKLIAEKIKNVYFLMVGREVDEKNEKLKKWIEETGHREKFILLGERDDILKIMQSLDLLVSSSFGEAFPNVLIEAMACGVPVVATDVGDCKYIVQDVGKIVPRGDMKSLALACLEILNLLKEEKKRLSEQARKKIIENYEISKIVEKYKQLYEEVFEKE